jgi:hypothetical protein
MINNSSYRSRQKGVYLGMTLSLKESQVIVGVAELLYSFLPGSGAQAWRGHISFRTVAEKSGVGDFWQSGSKQPMIIALLERTLEYRRRRFEPLILEIVRAGITYRHKQGDPVKPEEIDILNGLLIEVGFKFPDLWDSKFREALQLDSKVRAKEHVKRILKEQEFQAAVQCEHSAELSKLSQDFFSLHDMANRQEARYYSRTFSTDCFVYGIWHLVNPSEYLESRLMVHLSLTMRHTSSKPNGRNLHSQRLTFLFCAVRSKGDLHIHAVFS